MDKLMIKFKDTKPFYPAELERFLHGSSGDSGKAIKAYEAHLKWRASSLPLPATAPRFGRGEPKLPPWVLYLDGVTAIDGSTIVFSPGALCDPDLAKPEEYALAAAELLDSRLPRDESAKFTILIDTKGLKGGANPPAQKLVPYLQKLASVIGYNFPGRLASLVVYPVPSAMEWVWAGLKMFMDADTASKVKLLSGELAGEDEVRYPPSLAETINIEAVKKTAAAPLFAAGGKNAANALTIEAVSELCLAGYGLPEGAVKA
jgi:hypothetical protein